jgi:membrane-associated protein
LGNYVGYWFGLKADLFIPSKRYFLFKKKYLHQAHDFYQKYGGWAIVAARFVPIIRTFAPIVAGIVRWKKRNLLTLIW